MIKIDKWECMKLKRFCTRKEAIKRSDRLKNARKFKLVINLERSKVQKHKKLKNLNATNNKWDNEMDQQFPKHNVQLKDNYMKTLNIPPGK